MENVWKKNTNLEPLYKSLGDLWKQEYPNWVAWLLSGNRRSCKKGRVKTNKKNICV